MTDRHALPGEADATRDEPIGPSGESLPVESSTRLGVETARRQYAEEAWRESEERYRRLVENSEDAIFAHDRDGVLLSANPALPRLTGYDLCEMVGRRLDRFLAADSATEFAAYLETIFRDGHAHGFLTIRCRSGEERVLQYDNVIEKEAGRPVVRAIAHDVQRRWAENALRLSVGRLEALLNNIPDLAWLKDEEGRYSAVNEPFARFVGKPREQFIGRTDRELFPPEMAARFEDSDRRAIQGGGSLHLVNEVRDSEGALQVFDTSTTPIRDTGGAAAGTAGIARDMTERRKLEEQLFHAQKMEAIGRLAGGVAHDFNNLLTTILGYSGILLDQLADADPSRPDVLEIQRAGERAAELTRQLLAFSRKQVFEPSLLDLNAIVSESTRMLRRLIGENIELVTKLEPGLGSVRADRGQVDQVLINLAVNARDAMPQGGTLRVETRRMESSELPDGGFEQGAAPAWVLLSVTDSGSGMDPETRRRIFEPFFTTKERGKGTGLGLATVYGIVRQSGGNIWVESDPGRGTAFRICLPRLEAAAPAAELPAAPAPLRGTETLLLVEDEEALRRLATRVLEAYGYEVLGASEAEEAVRQWERHRSALRLLITDVIMPGASGPSLAGQLTKSDPALKVLYISGYTDSSIGDSETLAPGTAFLQKPFTPEALARKVRQILDGDEPSSEAPPAETG